jgi:hypothetical protein
MLFGMAGGAGLAIPVALDLLRSRRRRLAALTGKSNMLMDMYFVAEVLTCRRNIYVGLRLYEVDD